jgi:glycosyltransferase involved in cell wall biosynthesis
MVLIEAMASACLCVAYDCPCGPRAIINTDEDGFLVQDGNEDDFVEKLNRFRRSGLEEVSGESN